MASIVDYTADYAPTPSNGRNASTEIASVRTGQEVQAMVVMAKRFPRDEEQAFARIMRACDRRKLAEVSQYAYPRGDKLVTGPSIRLAEVLAQSWGNIDFGIVELEQRNGESQVQAYCWDLETNCRQAKVFTVRHVRHTKKGSQRLWDPRDIYELVANQGARRLRACILGVIPGDVIEAALERCDRTLAGNGKERLIDRVRRMVVAFAEYGVTKEMIEKRLNHTLESTTEPELVQLGKIFTSIRDGMASAGAYFEFAKAEQHSTTVDDLRSDFDGGKEDHGQRTDESMQSHGSIHDASMRLHGTVMDASNNHHGRVKQPDNGTAATADNFAQADATADDGSDQDLLADQRPESDEAATADNLPLIDDLAEDGPDGSGGSENAARNQGTAFPDQLDAIEDLMARADIAGQARDSIVKHFSRGWTGNAAELSSAEAEALIEHLKTQVEGGATSTPTKETVKKKRT